MQLKNDIQEILKKAKETAIKNSHNKNCFLCSGDCLHCKVYLTAIQSN